MDYSARSVDRDDRPAVDASRRTSCPNHGWNAQLERNDDDMTKDAAHVGHDRAGTVEDVCELWRRRWTHRNFIASKL
jgi:hypothetical protein